MPFHCNEKDCDCRRVLLAVHQANEAYGIFHAATISFGWEELDFYRTWGSSLFEEEQLRDFKGPSLEPLNHQSEYADLLLDIFKTQILDREYVKRLERQYAMVKYKVGMKLAPKVKNALGLNEPCPCESGLTFSNCCGKISIFKQRHTRRR